MPNIEYIITAEFHVDKGPSVVHQYPETLPGTSFSRFSPSSCSQTKYTVEKKTLPYFCYSGTRLQAISIIRKMPIALTIFITCTRW